MIRKLKYKKIIFKDLEINFARNFCRTLHITIKPDLNIYYVVPYGTDELEIEKFLYDKYDWIKQSLDKLEKKTQNIALPEVDRNLKRAERKELEHKLYWYIKKYEELLGVKVNKFSIRKMRTMWGSCSFHKASIRFNSKLYFKPDEFVEYIVLHEVCHLIEPNHSRSFYKLVARYMPDYKRVQKM